MNSGFSGLLADAETAVMPLVLPDGAEVVALTGDVAHFSVPGGEVRITLPFGDGDRFEVERCALDLPGGERDVYLLIPAPQGRRVMSVSIHNDRGIWFAVGRLAHPGAVSR